MLQVGLHESYYQSFVIYFLAKNEKCPIFSGGSSTNHTGFSDPTFYYTFQHVMGLAGHIGSGTLKDKEQLYAIVSRYQSVIQHK